MASAKTKNTNKSETRWRRRKVQRPDEILKAALDCFAESGFAATRLDEIARRAGVSKGTLYLYFSSKEEIFKAVVRAELIPNLANMEKILADANISASESLRRLLQFLSKIFVSSKISAIPKLIISEAGNFPELARFYHDEVASRGIGLISGIIRRGIEKGEFRPLNIEYTVYIVIAPMLFAVIWKHSLEPHTGRKINIETLFESHIDLILNGMVKKENS
jgi:AcrR family transcriptional regulator